MGKIIKIGILNFHYCNNNYGAVLQSYALKMFLDKHGFRTDIIDFKPKQSLFGIGIKQFLIKLLLPNHFDIFRKKHIKDFSKSFYSMVDLENQDLSIYDVFIVGSDQVWRPKYCIDPLVYFLPFASDNQKKISYAASFGVDFWEKDNSQELTLKIKDLISKFDSISVREDSGIEICKDIFDVKAVQVLDPTLLLGKEAFENIIDSEKVEINEIVYYKFDKDQYFEATLDVLAQRYGLTVKNIYQRNISLFNKNILSYYSVSSWISSIRNSKLVVTDSFHCVCFCILFHKQFIYFPNVDRGLTRVKSLLTMLGIEDRIFFSLEEILERNDVMKDIDYSKVDYELYAHRKFSKDYLLQSLEK